jgi:hypothetical protein
MRSIGSGSMSSLGAGTPGSSAQSRAIHSAVQCSSAVRKRAGSLQPDARPVASQTCTVQTHSAAGGSGRPA